MKLNNWKKSILQRIFLISSFLITACGDTSDRNITHQLESKSENTSESTSLKKYSVDEIKSIFISNVTTMTDVKNTLGEPDNTYRKDVLGIGTLSFAWVYYDRTIDPDAGIAKNLIIFFDPNNKKYFAVGNGDSIFFDIETDKK